MYNVGDSPEEAIVCLRKKAEVRLVQIAVEEGDKLRRKARIESSGLVVLDLSI